MPSPSIWSPIASNGRARARVVTRRRARDLAMPVGVAVVWLTLALAPGSMSGRARASIMVALELPDLVQQADHIAVVDVRSVRSEWDAKHERIYSTIELGVVDLWKSSPSSAVGPGATTPTAAPTTLTIVQPGGTVGDISMVVMGMSHFVPGTRSLVFLRGQAAHAQVVGMSQGLHPLTFESTTRRWTVAPPALGDVKLVPRATAPVRPPTTTQISAGSRLSASALPPAATAISPVSPRAPVALDVMKAEVLRLMSIAAP